MRRIAGVFLAAVVMFFWGFVFWTMIPTPTSVFAPLPEASSEAVVQSLKQGLPEPGVYMYPNPMNGETDQTQWMEAHEAGPLMTIYYEPGGRNPASPRVMIVGFVHMLAACAIATIVLWLVGSRYLDFSDRWVLIFLIGILGAFWSQLGRHVWFFEPLSHVLYRVAYDVVAWGLAAVVLAWASGGKATQPRASSPSSD